MIYLCPPALVYLIISVFGILVMIAAKQTISAIVLEIIFSGVWCLLLNLICVKGYITVSWILALLPYVIITFMFFFISEFIEKDLLENVEKNLLEQAEKDLLEQAEKDLLEQAEKDLLEQAKK